MKNLYFLFFLIAFGSNAQTNPGISWGWEQAFGSDGNAFAKRVVYDDSSNMYILGETSDTLIVAGDTVVGFGGIVLKLDSAGNPVWLRGQTSICNEISIGPDHNIYCSDGAAFIYSPGGASLGSWGWLTGTDVVVDKDTAIISVGYESDMNCFCLTGWINKTGPLAFYTTFVISNDMFNEYRLSAVDVDDSANIYIGGSASGALNYSAGSFSLTGTDPVIFVIKMDKYGNVIWIKNIQNYIGNGAGLTTILDLDVNPSLNSLAITGTGANNLIIGSDTVFQTYSSGFAMGTFPYVGLIDLDGTERHISSPVSNLSEFWGSTFCGGTAVKLDDDGTIYMMGYFNDTLVIGSDSIVEDTTINNASMVADDMFFTKMDTAMIAYYGRYVGNIGMSMGFYNMGDFDVNLKGEICVVGTTIDSVSRAYAATPSLLYAAKQYIIPVSAFSVSTDTICIGTCLSVIDNSSGSPVSWNWTFNGSLTPSSTAQNPGTVCYSAPGYYMISLEVCNAGGCDTITQTITVLPLPVADAGVDVNVCSGDSITLSATGGVLYSWMPSSSVFCSTCSNAAAFPTANTIYTVTVTDIYGCESFDDVAVTVVQAVATAGNDTTICEGESVQLNGTGGVSYAWGPQTSLSCGTCSSPLATPTTTTSYSMTVTDAGGCTGIDTIVVTVDPCLGINMAESKSITIYPNPATNVLRFDARLFGKYLIYDSQGKVVLYGQLNNSDSVDVTKLSNGIYTIRFAENSGWGRFVIEK